MVIDASGARIDRTAMLAFRDSTRQAFAGFGKLPGHRVGLVSTMLARGIGGSVAGSP